MIIAHLVYQMRKNASSYCSGQAAMFVSNHNSWMDIPFLGHTIGWKNYKFVAKKELEKVPILGKAIQVAKNVLLDRSDRRSQLLTLKQGMKWLDVSTIIQLVGVRTTPTAFYCVPLTITNQIEFLAA